MAKLKSFILNNFTKSFMTLFLPFYVIISLTYLIKLSNLSSKVNLDLGDFATLYLFVVPHIIFATIPLTFVGAVINTFSKLSEDNEAIAIFSLGYSPFKIVKLLIPIAFLFSIFLIILTLYIIPYADQKMDNFENRKIYEAKLKILPKKLSQSFGKHHIFIEKNIDGKFKNITMFTQEKNGYLQILLAKDGSINSSKSSSYLNLNRGTLYRYKDSIFQIVDFENMKLYNDKRFYSSKIKTPIEFWKDKKNKFLYFLLISISPISILTLLISLGIYNPRYQENRASIYILFSTLIVYIPAMVAKESASVYVTVTFIVVWIVISILFYKFKLAKRL